MAPSGQRGRTVTKREAWIDAHERLRQAFMACQRQATRGLVQGRPRSSRHLLHGRLPRHAALPVVRKRIGPGRPFQLLPPLPALLCSCRGSRCATAPVGTAARTACESHLTAGSSCLVPTSASRHLPYCSRAAWKSSWCCTAHATKLPRMSAEPSACAGDASAGPCRSGSGSAACLRC